MAELADAADSKSAGLRPLGVRLPLPAPASSVHVESTQFTFPLLPMPLEMRSISTVLVPNSKVGFAFFVLPLQFDLLTSLRQTQCQLLKGIH